MSASLDHHITNRGESEGSPQTDQNHTTLTYEPGQYRPSQREGHRKYSNKFMLAVLDSMQLDNKQDPCESVADPHVGLCPDDESLKLPYEEGNFSPSNPDGHRRYSNKFLRAVGRSVRVNVDKQRKLEPHFLDSLPYEPDQYKPTNPEGDKRYSAKFLKALGEMLMPDEDAAEIAPLLSERSIFPWDLHVVRSNRYRNQAAPQRATNDIWL